MSDIHYRLLIGLAAAGICVSCATATPEADIDSLVPSTRDLLVIDMSGATATAPRWRSEIVDCSDQNYSCVLIPGRMALAFPKSCSVAAGGGAPDTRYGQFHQIAPAPHLAPPSGGYVIQSFPHVLLYYNINDGLDEVRVVRQSPFDPNFNPNDYTERYIITTRTGAGLFTCSQ